MAKADRIVSFIFLAHFSASTLARSAMTRVGPSAAGGTRYGCDIRSGGTLYSATDGPGGRILRGDHPRRDTPNPVGVSVGASLIWAVHKTARVWLHETNSGKRVCSSREGGSLLRCKMQYTAQTYLRSSKSMRENNEQLTPYMVIL